MRRELGPSIRVEILATSVDASTHRAVGELPEGVVTWAFASLRAPINIINTSRKNRVSLRFVNLAIIPDGPSGESFTVLGTNNRLALIGVEPNLGPQEQTAGDFQTYLPVVSLRHPHKMLLTIEDRLTGRQWKVPVPGSYPPPS